MPIITTIEKQKQYQHRYNIYIDNTFAFGISEETLIAYRLHQGMDISDTLKEEIITHNAYQKVYSKALNYISYAPRSEQEVREKLLSDTTIHTHFIEKTILKLKEDNYINDTFYAEAFVQTALNLTKKSRFAIEKALRKKGIAQTVIQNALQQITTDTELAFAIEIAQKYQAKQHHLSQLALMQKIKLHLVQKGFSFHLAEQTLKHLTFEDDELIEWKNLCYQGDKIWRTYRLKYTDKELQYKMQQHLYQKGFNYDLIKRYLHDKIQE